MTIEDIKRALVEVSELCMNNKCSSCPFAKRDDANATYCPLTYLPSDWDVDDFEEDSNDTETA